MQVQLAETTESVELRVEKSHCKPAVLHTKIRITLCQLPILDTSLLGIIWRTSYVSASTGEHGVIIHLMQCHKDSTGRVLPALMLR